MRKAYGFDRPLPVQFGIWVWNAVNGNLGTSIASGRSVTEEVMRAVGNTVMLAVFASLIGFVFGVMFGFLAGYFRDTWVDKLVTTISITGVSMPHYWLGMVLVIVFSVQLGWLPAVGAGPGGWAWDWEHFQYLILPAVTMSVIPMGIITRTVRALVGDLLSQEFVLALRAKGLTEKRVFVHVAKNAAPTAIAVMGLAARLSARRLDPDRDRVLLAGHRLPAQLGDLPARPAAAAGHDPGARAVLRVPQSRGRRDPGGDRPAHQAGVR